MLNISLNNGKSVYVDLQPDDGVNKGGFYAKMFRDNQGREYIDTITIEKELVAGMTESMARTKAIIATNFRVKQLLNK